MPEIEEESMPEMEEDISEEEFPKPEFLRRIYYLIAATAALAIISLIPTPAGLSVEGQRALGVLVFVTILWITETFPLGLTAFLVQFYSRFWEL